MDLSFVLYYILFLSYCKYQLFEFWNSLLFIGISLCGKRSKGKGFDFGDFGPNSLSLPFRTPATQAI